MDSIKPNQAKLQMRAKAATQTAAAPQKPIFAATSDQVSLSPPQPAISVLPGSSNASARTASPPTVSSQAGASAAIHNTAAPVTLSIEGPVTPIMNVASAKDAVTAVSEEFDEAVVISGDTQEAQVWIPSASSALVHTGKTKENMSRLAAAINSGEFTLLTGETGAGKTAVVKYMAHLTNSALRRVNLHDQTDEVELFGGYKPGPDGGFVWKDGTITSAIRHGHWLLLDELNLADQAVLERMNPLLDGDGYIVLTEKEDKERVKVHPNTRVFATQNPASYEGRKELSAAMFDRFQRKVFMRRLPDNELVDVLRKDFLADRIVSAVAEKIPDLDKKAKAVLKANVLTAKDDATQLAPNTVSNLEGVVGNSDPNFLKDVYNSLARGEQLSSLALAPKTVQILEAFQAVAAQPPAPVISDDVLMQMSTFHNKMVESAETRLLGKKGGPYPFTLRDLLKLSKRIKNYAEVHPEMNQYQLAWQQARDVYQARFMEKKDRDAVENFLQIQFGKLELNGDGAPPVGGNDSTMQNDGKNVRIGDTVLPVNPKGGPYVPDAGSKLVETPGTVEKLNRLARSAALDEPVLLVGPTAAGKTSLVRWLAHETNNEFRRVNLSNHTDTSELIGGYYPAVEVDLELAKKALTTIEGNSTLAKALASATAELGEETANAINQLRGDVTGLAGDDAKKTKESVRDALALVLSHQPTRLAFEEQEAMDDWASLEGAFRTVPGKFEWRDGIIVEAMKKGQWIVLDEINLAEPAVLEGLNSLLDGDRSLVLTSHLGEKVKAHGNFRVFATMNPATSEYGGRKKLSPAMRNRFTEQWFPEISEKSEIQLIAQTWVNEFKEDAQQTLQEYKAMPEAERTRAVKMKAVAAQALLKSDLDNLAEVVTDFQLDMRAKSRRQGDATPELPTAKKDGYHYTLRGMRSFLKYIQKNIGLPKKDPDNPTGPKIKRDLPTAFKEGVVSYFADGLSRPEDQELVKALGEEYAEKL